jgi:hypothetical protein
MITYKATSIKTGRYYIGSAKTYCHYMNRMGCHHLVHISKRKHHNDFHLDLWEDPRDFQWEILREDDLATREYEIELLRSCRNDPLNYNLCHFSGGQEEELNDGPRWSKEVRERMSASASRPEANPPHKKEAQRKCGKALQATKSPCPQCGMMLAPGNMVKHLKGTRCKGN